MTDANRTQPTTDRTAGHGAVSYGAATYGAATHGASAPTPSPSAGPTKNPLGTTAFILAIVMLVLGSTFAVFLAPIPGPIEQLRLVLLVQAATGALLSIVVVVLAAVSLLLKNRRRILGAIALGAGGYALLATILTFLGNAVATAIS